MHNRGGSYAFFTTTRIRVCIELCLLLLLLDMNVMEFGYLSDFFFCVYCIGIVLWLTVCPLEVRFFRLTLRLALLTGYNLYRTSHLCSNCEHPSIRCLIATFISSLDDSKWRGRPCASFLFISLEGKGRVEWFNGDRMLQTFKRKAKTYFVIIHVVSCMSLGK